MRRSAPLSAPTPSLHIAIPTPRDREAPGQHHTTEDHHDQRDQPDRRRSRRQHERERREGCGAQRTHRGGGRAAPPDHRHEQRGRPLAAAARLPLAGRRGPSRDPRRHPGPAGRGGRGASAGGRAQRGAPTRTSGPSPGSWVRPAPGRGSAPARTPTAGPTRRRGITWRAATTRTSGRPSPSSPGATGSSPRWSAAGRSTPKRWPQSRRRARP